MFKMNGTNQATADDSSPMDASPMQMTFHSERVFSIPRLLSAMQCEQLVALAEASGFEQAGVRTSHGQKAMPLVRNNERVLVESVEWVALLWQRVSDLNLPQLDG